MRLDEKPKKVTKMVQRTRTVSPARAIEEPTGEEKEIVIWNEKGEREVKREPITRRVEIPAVRADVQEEKEVHEVKAYPVKKDGTIDQNKPPQVHEFANAEDAKAFIKQTRRDMRRRGQG